MRCNQLSSDIQRRKSQVEKKLRLSVKKKYEGNKEGGSGLTVCALCNIYCMYVCVCVDSEPQEPVMTELSALEMEMEKQTVQLREWQMQELLELRKKQHQLEREKKYAHFEEVLHTHTLIHTLASASALHLQRLADAFIQNDSHKCFAVSIRNISSCEYTRSGTNINGGSYCMKRKQMRQRFKKKIE